MTEGGNVRYHDEDRCLAISAPKATQRKVLAQLRKLLLTSNQEILDSYDR